MSLKTNTNTTMTLFCFKHACRSGVVLIDSGSPHLDILVKSFPTNLTIMVEILAEMEAGDNLEAAFVMNPYCWPPPSYQNWHLSTLTSMMRQQVLK